MAKKTKKTRVKTLIHKEKTRTNIPTAESENLVQHEQAKPVKVLYPRNPDLDPQLVWKGKDEENKNSLEVNVMPIYAQEHIDPIIIIDDIKRQARKDKVESGEETDSLWKTQWDKELDPQARIEFYQHSRQWANRMILGDSLQVMTSLAKKENLRGQVQCIYIDPPYGINFSSNWQPSTKSRDVGDQISREPEPIRAFRDTWEHGVNSYLSYLRDRLFVAHELLTGTGSIFFQIGDENEHLTRCLLDEVFGNQNFIAKIVFKKTSPLPSRGLAGVYDIILWYGKNADNAKLRPLFEPKEIGEGTRYIQTRDSDTTKRKMTPEEKISAKSRNSQLEPFTEGALVATGYTKTCMYDFEFQGRTFKCGKKSWQITQENMQRLIKADRIIAHSTAKLPKFIRYHNDFPVQKTHNMWTDTSGASNPFYVVQTTNKVVQRCILMATDPGDIVLDPTCGSGTTAVVSEEWGRRWITIDTSRVSLALARSRLIGSRYDWYKLKSDTVSGGFKTEVVPHINMSSIAHNREIDVIWERYQEKLEPLRKSFNSLTGEEYQEWEMPPVVGEGKKDFPAEIEKVLKEWWVNRIARQKEIDASIAENANYEELLDQPEIEKGVLRVTGPFTVESLSPHRVVLPTNAGDEAIAQTKRQQAIDEGKKPPELADTKPRPKSVENGEVKFHKIVWDRLAKEGVTNTKKGERLMFDEIRPWQGDYIQFEGFYKENGKQKRAAIFVGPEYGTVTRNQMITASQEASDFRFQTLIVFGFSFEARADENLSERIGNIKILRSGMNQDLRMNLKGKKSGNSFVIFGEPDIELRKTKDGMLEVEILGLDIFDPTTGDIKSSDTEDIACWFIDTNYSGQAFFVCHTYFSSGLPDPFKRLKTTLKAEINKATWDSLYTTTSRPFAEPASGKIAVKAINHYGDEVLRVFETTEAKEAKPPSQ